MLKKAGQWIFAVRNERKKDCEHKVVVLFGIKIKIAKRLNFAVVKLSGGLGNQMFQYAFGKAFEQKNKVKVYFDKSWFVRAKKAIVNDKNENKDGMVMRDYGLDVFDLPIRVANKQLINKCLKTIKLNCSWSFDEEILKKTTCTYFDGHFQNEKYFKFAAKNIKKYFKFPQVTMDDEYNRNLIDKIKKCENSVFMHVRWGDYANLGWVLDKKYYDNAINYMRKKLKNPTFFVFGKDCEEFMKEFACDDNFVIVGEDNALKGEDFKDMMLMASCKHAIIANSTFSFWAAWLVANNRGIVAAPSPFLYGNDEIVCDNWVKIKY